MPAESGDPRHYHRSIRVMVAEAAMKLETTTIQRIIPCPRCGRDSTRVQVTVDPNLDGWEPLVEVKARCPLCGWAEES